MSRPLFPARRLRNVGATADEVAAMLGAFNRSDLVVQRDQVDFFKSQSAAGLRAYVAAWRAQHGAAPAPAAELVPTPSPEVAAPTEASGALSGDSGESEPEAPGAPEA